jgi:hypothetical protein
MFTASLISATNLWIFFGFVEFHISWDPVVLDIALVDLIAAAFYSKRMRSGEELAAQAFPALFCMSVSGVWA